ncbi:TPA: MobV family relaxase [Escherichia coli O103:H2]
MSDAPNFAILRTQKLKHLASVRRSLKHSFREQDTPNADQSLTPENSHYGAHSTAEAMSAVQARLPEKRRKDAVLAIEYLVTASPEAMHGKSREEQDAYFADSLEWLRERHGAENVVYAGVHRDETTPHMYAYVVPLDRDTGRLNAKKWLGGSKALNQMQTEFVDRIGQRHGLERGIERSKARHQTIRQFYGNLEAADRQQIAVDPKQVEPQTLKKGLFTKEVESPEMVAARLSKEITQANRATIEKASVSAQERRNAKALRDTAKEQQKRLQTLQEPFKGLSKDQMAEVLKMAVGMQRENERAKEAKKTQILEKFQAKRERERNDRSRGR